MSPVAETKYGTWFKKCKISEVIFTEMGTYRHLQPPATANNLIVFRIAKQFGIATIKTNPGNSGPSYDIIVFVLQKDDFVAEF